MGVNYIKMLSNMDKLPVHTEADTLDIYCEYLLNDSSKYINFANLTNLQDYINRMDPKLLMTNDGVMARYEFIRTYLEARIDRGIVSRKMCLRYVEDNVDGKYMKLIRRYILDSVVPDQLKKKDIEFINDMIFAQLNVLFLHAYKAPVQRLFEDLDNGEFGKAIDDCTNGIQLFQRLVSELTKAQRRSKQDNRFNLTDEKHFKAIMAEALDRLLSESQYWQTGMQGLNNMLGGGLENARIYNFIGATGGFKSGLMLNIWKQVKLFNRGHEHKDKNKRPTVLFISQENNIWETILRIFGIFGTTDNIKKYNAKQIMEILAKGGFTVVNDDLDIDLEFRYYGNMDIGVPDLRGICEELDNQGREVIGIVQDYIERLRPPIMQTDRRQQLNDISNQMHDLAIDLDIWIVTGSQFNREGVATIEDLRAQDKHDIGKKVGSKNVSESFGMLKNFDVNISIIIEYDATEERYWLSFRRLKFRGDDTDRLDYFCQPFVGKNSKIQLMVDINEDRPVYRKSMLDDINLEIMDEANSMDQITRRNRAEIIDMEPQTVDADDLDIGDFYNQFQEDISRNTAVKADGSVRDKDGFYVLIRKPKKDAGLDLEGLPGKVINAKIA